jgi:hypothetical protein
MSLYGYKSVYFLYINHKIYIFKLINTDYCMVNLVISMHGYSKTNCDEILNG